MELCREYGADLLINYEKNDLKTTLKELTAKNGVDVIYDPVGGDYSEAAFRGIAWEGRFLVVGFAAGSIPRIPLNLPLLKGASIVGVFWGAFAMKHPELNMQNAQTLMQWFQDGALKPHIHKTYTLEDTPKALEEMMSRKVRGKVVVRM